MADYGFKITLPNDDVSSTDPRNYIVWSKYSAPKTYIVGTASIGCSTEADTQSNHNVTISHNLGYVPVVAWFWATGGQYSGGFWSHGIASGHNTYSFVTFNVTSTQLIINYTYDNIGGGDGKTLLAPITWNFKYYIFIDQGL